MMVFINGIAQVPGADYVAGDSTVSFCAPPPVNSTIQVTTPKYNRLMFNGDGKTYTYQTVVQDMQSTKVRLGKGLRARYFAFELISTGPDFDLDTVEFLPLVAQRRV